MGGNTTTAFERAFCDFRDTDVRNEAKRRHEEQQIAAERGLWALADLYMPNDIREAGERWKLPHVLEEQWRAAFIAGWRAATAAGLRAAADVGAGPGAS